MPKIKKFMATHYKKLSAKSDTSLPTLTQRIQDMFNYAG